MIGVIIFGLILFCLASGLAYLVSYFPTKWFVKTNKIRVVRLILSALIGLFITVFYIFISPVQNNETATIEAYENQYIVTVTGKRMLRVHNPISFLKRGTYLDSLKIIIPRAEGIIKGQEIPTAPGYYKMLGTLIIENKQMSIDLYYDNDDDKTKDALSWNGEYELQWRKDKN